MYGWTKWFFEIHLKSVNVYWQISWIGPLWEGKVKWQGLTAWEQGWNCETKKYVMCMYFMATRVSSKMCALYWKYKVLSKMGIRKYKLLFKNIIFWTWSNWSGDVPQKVWERSVKPFWRLLDTNKQTHRQRSQIYR